MIDRRVGNLAKPEYWEGSVDGVAMSKLQRDTHSQSQIPDANPRAAAEDAEAAAMVAAREPRAPTLEPDTASGLEARFEQRQRREEAEAAAMVLATAAVDAVVDAAVPSTPMEWAQRDCCSDDTSDVGLVAPLKGAYDITDATVSSQPSISTSHQNGDRRIYTSRSIEGSLSLKQDTRGSSGFVVDGIVRPSTRTEEELLERLDPR